MTSIKHRPFYTQEELDKLYPKSLELTLVQVLMRHGERAPVSARFRNAGLSPYWPYCHAAQQMRSVIYSPSDVNKWDSFEWRRRLERFGDDDGPVVASGPSKEVDGICQLGELTDKGRETTYELGTRLRHLYIDQLGFMPKLISDSDMIYLRATPMPRALESVQQAFWGMYPLTSRAASFPPPTILSRTPADETLYPNEGGCRRFGELSKAFAQKAAEHWNDSEDMKYVTKKISKWMPEEGKVAVDSHPRLSGIMDTINSTLAHGPETRLPAEFYDDRLRQIIENVGTEEWFAGYTQNREYRTLGIGALAGDIVERMGSKIDETGSSVNEVGGDTGKLGKGRGGETSIKLGLSGCHDTTLAALMAGLGAFEGHAWPPYTSHIAVELFKSKDLPTTPEPLQQPIVASQSESQDTSTTSKPGWIASMLGIFSSNRSSTVATASPTSSAQMGRKSYTALSSAQKSKLNNHYVRVRFNDKALTIPACKEPGNHFEGDETLCTFEAFKRVVDGFTPKSWKGECNSNLGADVIGTNKLKDAVQPAGHIEEGC